MASATPATAIEDRLKANWTTTPVYLADEIDAPPDPPSAFVVLEFPGGSSSQYTIGSPGNNVFLEAGAFMIHVLVPLGNDSQGNAWRRTARTYAETIAEIFRAQTFATSVITYAPDPPHESDRSNGNFWGVSFGVPYHYQFTA